MLRDKGELWNKDASGFDSPRWPFDMERAVREPYYCKAVVAASTNSRFDSVWRNAAKDLLETVRGRVELLVQAYVDLSSFTDEYGFK